MIAPNDDISRSLNLSSPSRGPLLRTLVMLQGQVVGHPQWSDFGVEFVLQCSTPTHGCVWVKAPLDAPVTEGATIQANALLFDLPRVGNDGERSRHLRYILDDCWCLAQVKQVEDIRIQPHAPRPWLTEWMTQLRAGIPAYYASSFSQRGEPYPQAMAQLLSAMVFGEAALSKPLPGLTRDEFRAAGLTHLLVASGTQISLFALLLLGFTRVIGLRRWWMLGAVLPILLFYALLTGGEASIWRATIGGICLCLAILLGRDIDGLSLWSLALAALLIVDPAQLYSLSFQLTFAATWGLIVLAPHLDHGLRHYLGESSVTQLAALSLGAQLATVPLLMYHFGRISTIGLGANFIGVPLAGVLVATGVMGLAVPAINTLNYSLTQTIATIATLSSRSPGAQIEASPLRLSWTLWTYAGILGAVLIIGAAAMDNFETGMVRDLVRRGWQQQQRRGRFTRPQAIIPLLFIVLTAYTGWRTLFAAPHQLLVTVLDVGQGESILVQSPSGRVVLIDGGTLSTAERGDVGRSVIVPYLQSRGVHRLDAVVVTHSDADHLNALPQVLREVPVGLILDGATTSNEPGSNTAGLVEYQNLMMAVRQRNIPRKEPHAGQRLDLGGGAVLTVLSPLEPLSPAANDNSVVMRLDYGKTSMLLTGDIEQAAEERLVRRGANLRCTVLKVAHHGSKTSTSPMLMRAARPSAAVISCGRYNPFGHPAAQTLQHLTSARVPFFRTDVDGAIEIRSDGKHCWFQTFR